MKILFLSSLYPPHTRGGGELSTHYLAQALRTRGHDVTVITEGERDEIVTVDGVPVHQVLLPLTAKPLLEERASVHLSKKLEVLINKGGPYDIVHAHDLRTTQALAPLQLPNAVTTVRDYASICGSPNNLLADESSCPGCESLKAVVRNRAVVEAPLVRKPFRIWQYRYNIGWRRRSFKAIRHHVYISQAQLNEIKKYQDLAGIDVNVIYNPAPQLYIDSAPKRTRARNLVFIGTLESYKGLGLLLAALPQLLKEWPDIHLTVVGEGSGKHKYERFVAQHGLQYAVTFVGYVAQTHMMRYFDEARIVVAPHVWTEPFGRTVIEAMARRKLVVSANRGGPGDYIKDGKTGLLFAASSSAALTQRLRDALRLGELDKREIEDAAHRWVVANLRPDAIAEQYERVYEKVRALRTRL